jgi:signal transduction histidine kinase
LSGYGVTSVSRAPEAQRGDGVAAGGDRGSFPSARGRLLVGIAYAVWAAVAVVSMLPDQAASHRLLAGVLYALFAIVMAFWYIGPTELWQRHLDLALGTAIVLGLRVVQPDSDAPAILFYLLGVRAVVGLSERAGLVWEAVLVLAAFASFVVDAGHGGGLAVAAIYVSGLLFFGVFAGSLRRVESERQRAESLLQALNEAHRKLQEHAMSLQELAAAEERTRLAREMHDTLGHSLTMAVVQLEGARRLTAVDPARAEQIVGVVRDELREGLGELRRSLATMRAPLEAELPLPQSLPRLVTRVEAVTHLAVHLALPPTLPPLLPEHRLALYRAAQEGLTNVQRHSRAREVWLTASVGDGIVSLVVADDGVGFPPDAGPGGFGLRGLRERAEELGGGLVLAMRPSGGAELHFQIRLPEERRDG